MVWENVPPSAILYVVENPAGLPLENNKYVVFPLKRLGALLLFTSRAQGQPACVKIRHFGPFHYEVTNSVPSVSDRDGQQRTTRN